MYIFVNFCLLTFFSVFVPFPYVFNNSKTQSLIAKAIFFVSDFYYNKENITIGFDWLFEWLI
jgi:hypothetical protein